MNPIDSAFSEGYTEDQILNFIQKKYPNLSGKISQALRTGYSPQVILRYLTPFFQSSAPSKRPRATTQQEAHANVRVQEREENQRLMKNLANLGIAVATGYGAGYGAKTLLQNSPKLAQFISKRGMPIAPGRSAMGLAQGTMGEIAGGIEGKISAPVSSQQQEKSARDILDEMGMGQRIKNISSNNPPNVVGSAIKSFMTPGQKTWLKNQTNKPIEDLVNEYLQEKPQEASEAPKEKLALTSTGQVGELVDERQGIGSIRLPSGKITRQKIDEIIQETPELSKQINDVLRAIPREEQSRVLGFVSYNPNVRVKIGGKEITSPFMGVQFHSGDFYLYPDVTQEQFNHVVSQAGINKTSGENEWGYWTKGERGRGTSFVDVKKTLEENFGKNFIKLKASEGYDFWKRFREELKAYFQRKKRNEI